MHRHPQNTAGRSIGLIWLRWRVEGEVADGSDEDARKLHEFRERRGF